MKKSAHIKWGRWFRLTICVCFIIIVIFITFGVSMYFFLNHDIIDDSTRISRINAEKTVRSLNNICSSTVSTYASFFANNSFMNTFLQLENSKTLSLFEQYRLRTQLSTQLLAVQEQNSSIKNIYLYAGYSHNLLNGQRSIIPIQEIEDIPDLQNISLSPSDITASFWQASGKDHSEAFITYIGRMKPINQKRNYGWMAISLSLNHLQSEITALNDMQSSYHMLLSSSGNPLIHTGNPAELKLSDYEDLYRECNQNKENGTFLHNSQKYGDMIVSFYPLDYGGFVYLSFTPVSSVIESVDQTKMFFILMCLIVLVIIEFSIFFFIYIVYKPIFSLLHEMKKFEKGDFSSRLYHGKNDEIKYIYDHYNHMVENIAQLIQDRYEQITLKQQAEIKILQNQINQHFLYNTLESIHWLCLKNEPQSAANFTMKLSMFYRLFLSNGLEMIAVRDVVSMLQNYCDIVQLRHGSKFSVDISCDEKIMDAMVCKYIFQPIVENAILHGVEQRVDGGTISIQFQQFRNRILFSVEDNGPGIPEEILMKLNQRPEDSIKIEQNNFALQCIKYQMKLIYHDDYSFNIESEINQGTIVTIDIPKL